MNNPLPPPCNKKTSAAESISLQVTIQANGDILIPWIPLEFHDLIQELLPPEEQAQQIFGPMLCG